jgi:hypothetical protein
VQEKDEVTGSIPVSGSIDIPPQVCYFCIMQILQIKPDHILTTHDFPVHNEHILKMYFKMARHSAQLIPPTPLIRVSLQTLLLPENFPNAIRHNQAIKVYLEKHPEIGFVMLDGSHKTTALTLTHNLIHALVAENDDDLQAIFKMVDDGELFGFCNPKTITETILEVAKEQSRSTDFHSISSKTLRMVEEKVIPQYMINYYNQS